MYHYYTYDGRTLCSAGALPYPEISALPETGEVLWVFHRPPLSGRDTFPVTDPAQLTEREGVASLCAAPGPEGLPRELTNAIRAGRVRAVNLAHPAWESLLAPAAPKKKQRLHLLALGDVGSTLLLGLRLMGADVLDSIGICDVNEKAAARWEFEINQIAFPWNYDALRREGRAHGPVRKQQGHCEPVCQAGPGGGLQGAVLRGERPGGRPGPRCLAGQQHR